MYLTVVFSNKIKGLLIVLSLSVRLSVFVFTSLDSETAGTVEHYELIHRETRKTNRLYFYIAVFLRFIKSQT